MNKFKVCLQQYVEKTAMLEVDAVDADEARRKAMDAIDTGGAVDLEWVDGGDACDVEAYAILDQTGQLAWER